MIENPTVGLIVVLIEAIGILLAERRTAFLLTFVTWITIILFFMT